MIHCHCQNSSLSLQHRWFMFKCLTKFYIEIHNTTFPFRQAVLGHTKAVVITPAFMTHIRGYSCRDTLLTSIMWHTLQYNSSTTKSLQNPSQRSSLNVRFTVNHLCYSEISIYVTTQNVRRWKVSCWTNEHHTFPLSSSTLVVQRLMKSW